MENRLPLSARIRRLQSDIQSGVPNALELFWAEVEQNGTPIIEPHQEEANLFYVTFVWRGQGNEINVVVSGFLDGGPAANPCENQMVQITGTDVWYRTYTLPAASRFAYYLVPNDPALLTGNFALRSRFLTRDPRNPKTYQRYSQYPEASIVHLPGAALETPAHVAPETGVVTHYTFRSQTLGQTRPIWVYTPMGYSRQAGPYPLILCFDGEVYLETFRIADTLDNLIYNGQITPTVAVLVGNIGPNSRIEELTCNVDFHTMVMEELLPWVRHQYNVSRAASQTLLAGVSLGGLTASWMALQEPATFGKVLSQSGSFWWSPDHEAEPVWFAREVAKQPVKNVRFYLEAGTFETHLDPRYNLLQANRHLRDVLMAKGYDVTYSEFHGGHDDQSWGITLPRALMTICGRT